MQQRNSQINIRAAAGTPRAFPLSQEIVTEILSRLTEEQAYGSGAKRRKSTRFDIGGTRSVITIQHPGGSIVSSECILIDISEGGVSFLYPGFLHTNTECAIQLETLGNETVNIGAKLVWCRFVTNPVHAIGVQWFEPIDVKQFIPSKIWLEQGSNSDSQTQQEIEGRALLVGFDEIENELLRLVLKDTKLEIVEADFSGAALDQITANPFDLLILNSECSELSTEELLRMVRETGSAEPILLLVDRSAAAFNAGTLTNVTVLEKPYNNDVILATIRDMLLSSANPLIGTGPIRSESKLDPGSVRKYIDKLKGLVPSIQAAAEKDDVPETTRVVSIMKNTAQAFGFPLLEEAASQVITQLNATASALESGTEIRTLIRVISRLQEPLNSAGN